MCCQGSLSLDLPAEVAEMLVEYRHLAGSDLLWGEGPEHGLARWLPQLRFVSMEGLMAAGIELARADNPSASLAELVEAAERRDPDVLARAALDGGVPPGLVALRIGDGGRRLEAEPARVLLEGRASAFSLLVDSSASRPFDVRVDGRSVEVAPRGARLLDLEWPLTGPLEVDGQPLDLAVALDERPPARLALRSVSCVRWSVRDASGGGWFPDGALRKWDFHRRPFFHACETTVEVPAGTLLVSASRGLEFENCSAAVEVAAGETAEVELSPERRRDPAARGWYGGDLHVHMNYGGDEVCRPAEAAVMQHGEGLHLMNLVAGNCTTSRIFDEKALEAWVGEDLAWSGDGAVARMGVEYRNDLLGHFHALGLEATPARLQSGHARSEHDEDWPANAVAAAECRRLGATVGYCHPVLLPIEDDPSAVFHLMPRSVEAREVVVDAALGLVDSLDVLSNMSGPGAAVLYRKLVGAGCRLAVTAGTDCFLSFSRCGTFSNPPGWARGYARLSGPLSVASYQEAVRAGRTMATNGPWLEVDVSGAGPGESVEAAVGGTVTVTASVAPPGAEVLRILTAEGEVARCATEEGSATLTTRLSVQEPTFVVAEASGGRHDEVLADQAFAHTSAVYVDVAGAKVARAEDARWCLRWIDHLEDLLNRHGRYRTESHRLEVLETFERARSRYRLVAQRPEGSD